MIDYPHEVKVSSRVEIAQKIYQQATPEQQNQMEPLLTQVMELQSQPQTNHQERKKVQHGLLSLMYQMARILTKDAKVFSKIQKGVADRHWKEYLEKIK